MRHTLIVGLTVALAVSQLACPDVLRELIYGDLEFKDDSTLETSASDVNLDIQLAEIDPSICEFSSDGTLKGVSIDLSGNHCVYSLSEISAGIDLHYRILVEQELHEVVSRPLDAGQCDPPGPSGLRTFEKIHGNDQTYCICDSGLCDGGSDSFTLMPGDYSDTFEWQGLNWNGPSDTGNLPGDPFPPGAYTLVVRTEGNHGPLQSDFAVTATMKIHLQQ